MSEERVGSSLLLTAGCCFQEVSNVCAVREDAPVVGRGACEVTHGSLVRIR